MLAQRGSVAVWGLGPGILDCSTGSRSLCLKKAAASVLPLSHSSDRVLGVTPLLPCGQHDRQRESPRHGQCPLPEGSVGDDARWHRRLGALAPPLPQTSSGCLISHMRE